MCPSWPVRLVLLGLVLLGAAIAMPSSTTPRSQLLPESIKKVADQLFTLNLTSDITFDTRTPPRVKQHQQQQKQLKQEFENSHAGIAIPIDEETILLEENAKKTHFYKVEQENKNNNNNNKPTTDSGLSTWILLSGQGIQSTTKPTRKAVVKPISNEANKSLTSIKISNNNVNKAKPLFKERPTTKKTTTTTITTPSTTEIKNKEANLEDKENIVKTILEDAISSTTPQSKKSTTTTTTKLTKIKASVLTNAQNNKNKGQNSTVKKQLVVTTMPSSLAADEEDEDEGDEENVAEEEKVEMPTKTSSTTKQNNDKNKTKSNQTNKSDDKEVKDKMTKVKLTPAKVGTGTGGDNKPKPKPTVIKEVEDNNKSKPSIVKVEQQDKTKPSSKVDEKNKPSKIDDDENDNKTKQKVANDKTKVSTVKVKKVENKIKSTEVDAPSSKIAVLQSNELPMEAKVGEVELTTQASKKSSGTNKRPSSSKRKKNKKNKNKKTSVDKNSSSLSSTSNSTKVSSSLQKEKPFGTQIYNYLSREVMPTVGVGLVGLMVTAGLASYFLYPFGALRRSYDIDRKDKDAGYYYNGYNSGGVAEEDMIGKVIAGMPENSFSGYSSRNGYPNLRTNRYPVYNPSYKTSSSSSSYVSTSTTQAPQASSYLHNEVIVQDSYIPQSQNYNNNNQVTYNDQAVKYQMTSSSSSLSGDVNQQFVVGSVPKEVVQEVTPVSVPEHGPRKFINKRSTDFMDNEIPVDEIPSKQEQDQSGGSTTASTTNTKPGDTSDAAGTSTTTSTIRTTTSTRKPVVEVVGNEKPNFFNLMRDIFNYKLRFGLEFLQNTTRTFSRYLTRVQQRLNDEAHES